MSSKLVKKLLNQTNTQLESNDDTKHQSSSKSRKDAGSRSRTTVTHNITKEEAIQGHIQSILRLDSLVQEHTSTIAQKSFTRRSSDLKLQAKKQRRLKKSGGGASNSRSSSSSFSKQRQQPTFNKDKEKRKKDEEYYSDIARALKKAKKRSKK
mmetsp:Transcript_25602/g.51323  ORF Transcript_25602/g.51323 Transcript_25602/m.51323 type:complete len:153 (-) Transcript_25602:2152-2610(-)